MIYIYYKFSGLPSTEPAALVVHSNASVRTGVRLPGLDGTLTVRTVRTVGMYRVPSPPRYDGIRHAATKLRIPFISVKPKPLASLTQVFDHGR